MPKTPGLPEVGHDLDPGEAGLARQLRHVLRALRIVPVLGRDRGQRDPLLKCLHAPIMQLGHLCQHSLHVAAVGGEEVNRKTRYKGSGQRGADEFPPVYIDVVAVFHKSSLPEPGSNNLRLE